MQFHRIAFAGLVSSILVATGAHAADLTEQPLQGDVVNGKALYDKHCMDCHGMNGMGGAKDGPRLTDSARMSALTNERFLDIIREGDSKRPKKSRHPKLPAGVERLDAWDVVGFIRARTVEVPAVFPDADRYLASPYKPDEHALERLEKTIGTKIAPEDASFIVVTAYKTGWGGAMELLPMEPKILDKLKRNMKVGYMVVVPLGGQERAMDIVFSLDVKTLAIVRAHVMTSDGTRQPDLDKQLERFVGKGDRRLSGQAKAVIKAGGGGKQFTKLEPAVTEAFVRAAEAVTAFEVQERERSWADDDL